MSIEACGQTTSVLCRYALYRPSGGLEQGGKKPGDIRPYPGRGFSSRFRHDLSAMVFSR